MKILWIDLNSSYAHSSLALPALHAQMMNKTDIEWCMVSATINENVGMIGTRSEIFLNGHIYLELAFLSVVFNGFSR